ncbi:uncharacterized [Tachysurus ichikawai]
MEALVINRHFSGSQGERRALVHDMNLFRVGRVGCFAWTAVSSSSELHAVICHWLPVFSLLHTTAHMSKRSIYLHAPVAPKQPQPQQAIKVCLHYTLVKLLLWGPVALPSGRKETNEMEVMRCSMLGSEWKAQFVAGERTYGTGNWPAGKGERGTAEVAKKNSQPEETMICNYLQVSVQFSADMKDRMEGGKAELSSDKTCNKRVKVFFSPEAVVVWEDFLTWISGWRTGRKGRKDGRGVLWEVPVPLMLPLLQFLSIFSSLYLPPASPNIAVMRLKYGLVVCPNIYP